MKVKCINNGSTGNNITVGKVYEVKYADDCRRTLMYNICDDRGECSSYFQDRFTVVPETITVKCIDAGGYIRYLTNGKLYEVTQHDTYSDMYLVPTDTGAKSGYEKRRFVLPTEEIPFVETLTESQLRDALNEAIADHDIADTNYYVTCLINFLKAEEERLKKEEEDKIKSKTFDDINEGQIWSWRGTYRGSTGVYDYYIVARIEGSFFALVGLSTGNRWHNPALLKDLIEEDRRDEWTFVSKGLKLEDIKTIL